VLHTEKTSPTVLKLVEKLTESDPARLVDLRREFVALAAEYFEDNLVRQDYLVTRATKI
jgi:hypothetical protein